MKTRDKNTRSWLIDHERYEDVIRFDASDKAKESFYKQMTGEEYDNEPNDDCDYLYEAKIKNLERSVVRLEELIRSQKESFDAQIDLFKGLLEKNNILKSQSSGKSI